MLHQWNVSIRWREKRCYYFIFGSIFFFSAVVVSSSSPFVFSHRGAHICRCVLYGIFAIIWWSFAFSGPKIQTERKLFDSFVLFFFFPCFVFDSVILDCDYAMPFFVLWFRSVLRIDMIYNANSLTLPGLQLMTSSMTSLSLILFLFIDSYQFVSLSLFTVTICTFYTGIIYNSICRKNPPEKEINRPKCDKYQRNVIFVCIDILTNSQFVLWDNDWNHRVRSLWTVHMQWLHVPTSYGRYYNTAVGTMHMTTFIWKRLLISTEIWDFLFTHSKKVIKSNLNRNSL